MDEMQYFLNRDRDPDDNLPHTKHKCHKCGKSMTVCINHGLGRLELVCDANSDHTLPYTSAIKKKDKEASQ